MTLVAALGEHRADLRLEVLEVLGRELLPACRRGDARGQHEDGAQSEQQADPDRDVPQRPEMCVHR